MRIAMWSGPRNLSTALMYSFGNRADFAVWDEPFYAPYLLASGIDHPMHSKIIERHETDPNVVANKCGGFAPSGKRHFYLKLMPHHMLPSFPIDWAKDCVNVHLIRHPARVIASYGVKRAEMTSDDIAFAHQAALFDKLGGLVLDSADIGHNPEGTLRLLCDEVGLAFDPKMLTWPAGPKAADGVWAAHWYGAVHNSTGFAGHENSLPELVGEAAELAAAAMPAYERLAAVALRP